MGRQLGTAYRGEYLRDITSSVHIDPSVSFSKQVFRSTVTPVWRVIVSGVGSFE